MTDLGEHTVQSLAPIGPQTEKLNYAVECKDIDFGLLAARNQLISKVVNPLIDMVMARLKPDHVVDSETKYKVSIVISSERDIDTVQ